MIDGTRIALRSVRVNYGSRMFYLSGLVDVSMSELEDGRSTALYSFIHFKLDQINRDYYLGPSRFERILEKEAMTKILDDNHVIVAPLVGLIRQKLVEGFGKLVSKAEEEVGGEEDRR